MKQFHLIIYFIKNLNFHIMSQFKLILNTCYRHELSLSSEELSAKCPYLTILTLPERTLDYLFSPWTTYCEIFHTHKPMGLLVFQYNSEDQW